MSYAGFTAAGAQLGLQTLIIKPVKRGFDNILTSDGYKLTDYREGGIQLVKGGLFKADAVLEEMHTDRMEITDHPIEQGANIADHAFKRPAEVQLKFAWSNSPVKSASLVNAALGAAATTGGIGQTVGQAVGLVQAGVGLYNQYKQNQGQLATPSNAAYQFLLYLQSDRAIFDIYTGRRKYANMIIQSLDVVNDWRTENSVFVTVGCKQVILVNTQTVTLRKKDQANPQATASPQKNGSKTLT